MCISGHFKLYNLYKSIKAGSMFDVTTVKGANIATVKAIVEQDAICQYYIYSSLYLHIRKTVSVLF
jgi:hypothetical protein